MIYKLLLASAYHAYWNAASNPKNIDYYKRAHYPKLGDYVFEASTLVNCFLSEDHKNYQNVKYSIGKLICVEWESSILDKDSSINDTLIRIDHRYPSASTIETFDGDIYRWINHQMILIPDHWKLI